MRQTKTNFRRRFARQAPRAAGVLTLLLPVAAVLAGAAPPAAHGPSHAVAQPASQLPDFATAVSPILSKFCISCHSGASPAAGLSFASYATTDAAMRAPAVWAKVTENLTSGHMPPAGMPAPSAAQKSLITGWAHTAFAPKDCRLQDPGRVTMRRLNRQEYNNTIRDLTGLDLHPADGFPSDDVGYGFDNIGDVLTVSPLLMEKYLVAAETVARAVVVAPEDVPQGAIITGKSMTAAGSADFGDGGRLLPSNGDAETDYDFPHTGAYLLKATAFGQQAGPDSARMVFKLDGKELETVDVAAVEAAPETYVVKVSVPQGHHKVALGFTNDFYNPAIKDPTRRDRNLIILKLEIASPAGFRPPESAAQRRVFICRPTPGTRDVAAKKILTAFASRAFRRPITPVESQRLMRCFHAALAQGESFERGIQLGIEASLVSPDFLFQVETNPAQPIQGITLLPDYQLASRLSYFLWGSMPDDALFHLAASGQLHRPEVLEQQVRRMMKDDRATSLATDFGVQWLTLRKLNAANPSRKMFPDFNSSLRDDMRTETIRFFQSIVSNDRSVLDFLNGKYTYINEALAKHYGMQGVTGPQFRRVELTDGTRGGVLTQASILTVTSNPTRTSPVKRGKWVLDQILGTPPPPPPPNVGQLPDDKKGPLVGTLRQRMEQHRSKPACANCHAKMDPLGFGLENFDATGAWRTQDGGQPVDASGVLPDGKSFRGAAELENILMGRKDLFVRCLAEKLLTYALGRGVEPSDQCALDAIAKRTSSNGYRFSNLITAIVQSDPFRKRKAAGGSA